MADAPKIPDEAENRARWGDFACTLSSAGKAVAAITLLVSPLAAWASPETDVAKAFVKAVSNGDDLRATYPDAVTEREAVSLQRLKGCRADNLMKQQPGHFTVVWMCAKGALGMEMTIAGDKLSAVTTFEVVARPNTDS